MGLQLKKIDGYVARGVTVLLSIGPIAILLGSTVHDPGPGISDTIINFLKWSSIVLFGIASASFGMYRALPPESQELEKHLRLCGASIISASILLLIALSIGAGFQVLGGIPGSTIQSPPDQLYGPMIVYLIIWSAGIMAIYGVYFLAEVTISILRQNFIVIVGE